MRTCKTDLFLEENLDDQRVADLASFGPCLLQPHVIFLHNPVFRSKTVNMAKAKAMVGSSRFAT